MSFIEGVLFRKKKKVCVAGGGVGGPGEKPVRMRQDREEQNIEEGCSLM